LDRIVHGLGRRMIGDGMDVIHVMIMTDDDGTDVKMMTAVERMILTENGRGVTTIATMSQEGQSGVVVMMIVIEEGMVTEKTRMIGTELTLVLIARGLVKKQMTVKRARLTNR
jgi:hypothetical protein